MLLNCIPNSRKSISPFSVTTLFASPMFHQRETNPHFHPRVQRYAQPPPSHPDDGLNAHTFGESQVPQRFRASPPTNSPPLKVPLEPHSQPPRILHQVDPHSTISTSPPPRFPPQHHTRPQPPSHHQGMGSHYPSPPLRVPPPRKTKSITWLIAICCVLFWIIIIVGGLILLIVYIAYRPRYPKFDIAGASLNAAYLDLGYLLNGDMTLLANFTNPNKKVNVDFRYMVVNLYFEGTLIAASYVEPLSVARRGYELRDVHMVTSQVPFSRTHMLHFRNQMQIGRITFEVKSLLRTTSNLGSFLRYSYWLYGHCRFVVSSPPGGILIAKRCITKR